MIIMKDFDLEIYLEIFCALTYVEELQLTQKIIINLFILI